MNVYQFWTGLAIGMPLGMFLALFMYCLFSINDRKDIDND